MTGFLTMQLIYFTYNMDQKVNKDRSLSPYYHHNHPHICSSYHPYASYSFSYLFSFSYPFSSFCLFSYFSSLV